MKDKIERIKSSLQIEEHIDLHITGWIIQRIGWALMLAFVLSSAAGLFGTGFLSHKKLTKDGIVLNYERFGRHQNDTELEIHANNLHGKLQLILPREYTGAFELQKIVPEPEDQKVVNGSNVYEFSAEKEAHITFYITPRQTGSVEATVVVNNSDFHLTHYIYP
jgi:hypothetical protein